jgi:hypothetical protein
MSALHRISDLQQQAEAGAPGVDVRGELVRIARKKNSAEEAHAAWAALQELSAAGGRSAKNTVVSWPATRSELAVEAGIRRYLADAFEKNRRLLDELAKAGPETLARALNGTDAAALPDLLKEYLQPDKLEQFGVADEGAFRQSLSRDVQYAACVLDFRREHGRRPPTETEVQTTERIRRFRDKVELLSKGVEDRGGRFAGVLKALDELLAAPAPRGGGGNGSGPAGPAQSVLKWKQNALSEAEIEFVSTDGRNSVRFARVGGPGTVYLSETEVSVGLFRNVVTAADAWAPMRALISDEKPVPEKDDLRKGPRAWVWDANPNAADPLKPPAAWLRSNSEVMTGSYREYPGAQDRKQALPAGAPGGDPSLEHPMQRVSLPASIYFASLLNCRLPTSSEWTAAYKTEQKLGAELKWNLRDEAFARQRDHVKAVMNGKRAAFAQYPDEGSFLAKVPPNRDAAAARADNDGVLWFSTVGSDGRAPGRLFRHLVGNVAEFVVDAKAPVSLTSDQVPEYVFANRAKLFVIGGSALSPPDSPVDAPLRVDVTSKAKTLTTNYSDVGFRLALDPPASAVAAATTPPVTEPLAKRFESVLEQYRLLADARQEQ